MGRDRSRGMQLSVWTSCPHLADSRTLLATAKLDSAGQIWGSAFPVVSLPPAYLFVREKRGQSHMANALLVILLPAYQLEGLLLISGDARESPSRMSQTRISAHFPDHFGLRRDGPLTINSDRSRTTSWMKGLSRRVKSRPLMLVPMFSE